MIPNLHLTTQNTRVVVAMSGGVDSSVAAALLVEQGYEVIGIMMRLWSDTARSSAPSINRCCTPDQMADARSIAQQLDIPFYVLDTQKQFRDTIVQHFIDQHRAGRTPNPCIACNREIRFTHLLQHAQAMGAQFLATGHYARVRKRGEAFELLQGADKDKDQSYVLHVLNQEKLAHVMFPVGDYTKVEVRDLARQFNLPVASKHESQDLCFVVDGDYRRFLQRHSEDAFLPGPILDPNGIEIGRHEGLPAYTIGQRKGLGISAEQPMYVLKKDRASNAIVVGPLGKLGQSYFQVRDVNWISGLPISPDKDIQVKIRYKAGAISGRVLGSSSRSIGVVLNSAVSGITPGQGAVFYDGEVCLGGGIIDDFPHGTPERVNPLSLQLEVR